MRKVIGGLCCAIVALQILVAVPLVVCCAFYVAVQGGHGGPFVVELHTGPRPPTTIAPAEFPPPEPLSVAPTATALAPPRNVIPTTTPPSDHPILQTRQVQGSPLAGTVLESCESPAQEQELFLAALEKAAAVCAQEPCKTPVELASDESFVLSAANCADVCSATTHPLVTVKEPVSHLLAHLYQMAELDERTGHFDRADQWRALARGLRIEE
jgi:hypothetical protein